MGLVTLRDGEDNWQKDIKSPPGGKGPTTGSLGIVSTWLADGYPVRTPLPPGSARCYAHSGSVSDGKVNSCTSTP